MVKSLIALDNEVTFTCWGAGPVKNPFAAQHHGSGRAPWIWRDRNSPRIIRYWRRRRKEAPAFLPILRDVLDQKNWSKYHERSTDQSCGCATLKH